jgi:hypothetical protein
MEQDNQQVAQYKAEIRKGIEGLDLSNEEIKQLDEMFTYIIQHPDQYAQVLQQAIESDVLDEGDLPEEYDAQLIAAILGVLKEMEARNAEVGYKAGGLAKAAKQLQAKGRGGDTILAHINPMEARALKRMGGSGTINPSTGLPEFKFGKFLKKAFKAVVKVAKGIVKSPIFQVGLMVMMPQLAPMLGATLAPTMSLAVQAAVGQAVIGGGMAALSGGNILKGAALGGIGGYAGAGGFGDMLPAGVTSGLSSTTKGLLNAGISGGLAGAVTGQGALKGALTAGATNIAGNLLQGYQPAADFLKGEGTLNKIANSALQGAGSAANIGGSPLAGAAMGTMGGAANIALQNMNFTDPTVQQALQPTAQEGINNRLLQPINYSPLQQTPVPPADVAPQAQNGVGGIDINQMTPNQLNSPMTSSTVQGQPLGGIDFSKVQGQAPGVQTGQGTATPISFNTGAPTTPTSFLGHLSNAAGGMSGSDMLKYGGIGLAGMGMLGGKKIPTTAQQEGHPDQRKLMNMIGGMDQQQRQYLESTNQLGTWLAQNWGNVSGGEYATPAYVPVGKANGGVLSMLARGGGSGRDDTIEARLSDGEYVIDAETVAMLGDGSTDEGASRLDRMRQQIRMHKGKNLSKGKISPNAKSPLSYLGSR